MILYVSKVLADYVLSNNILDLKTYKDLLDEENIKKKIIEKDDKMKVVTFQLIVSIIYDDELWFKKIFMTESLNRSNHLGDILFLDAILLLVKDIKKWNL